MASRRRSHSQSGAGEHEITDQGQSIVILAMMRTRAITGSWERGDALPILDAAGPKALKDVPTRLSVSRLGDGLTSQYQDERGGVGASVGVAP